MSCNTCGKPKCTCTKVITQVGKPGKRGTNGRPGPKGDKGDPGTDGTANLPVANTIYIMKNGNDSTGLVERMDRPFLTFAGARTAYQAAFTSRTETARIQVIVESGFYQENIILDKFVDFDLGNSVIDGGITDNQVDFGTTTDYAWTNVIRGNATINNTGTTALVTGLLIWRPNTKILGHFNKIRSLTNDCVVPINTKRSRIYVNEIYCGGTGSAMFAVEMGQGFSIADYTPSVFEIIGADIYNAAASTSATVSFESGGVLKDQTLTMINCRIKNINTAELIPARAKSAIACGSTTGSNGKLNLYNCVLYSLGGNSINVETGNTLQVKYFHSNMANAVTGGGGTLTNVLSTTLTVNAAVTPEF